MASAMEVARRYYEALSATDAQRITALFTPDSQVEAPGAVLEGPDQFAGWMQAFFDAFPDITHTVGELSEGGQQVSARLVVEGTQTAPLVSPQGVIPVTNRRFRIEAMNEMQVEGDKITHLKIDFDQADFMRQLGVGA